jgi:hypothetical protein
MLPDGFLLGLFFVSEDGDDMLLRNIGWLSADYTTLCPRTWNSTHDGNCFTLLFRTIQDPPTGYKQGVSRMLIIVITNATEN